MMVGRLPHYARRAWALGPLGAARRARARVVDELAMWGRSVWWGWKAHRGMSDAALLARTTGRWRSVEVLLEDLASRPASSFVLPHESRDATVALLERHYPDHLSAILAVADASCRNELNLLGRTYSFPGGIDWQRDPVTGWRWPVVHRSRVGRLVGSERSVDLIVFWELNRHQHFVALGIAFWLTGDQRYVDAFNSQLQSWIETNPIQHGLSWHYGLEVSIRLMAWTVAFQFFRSSPRFRERMGKAFLKSLWQQADFLSAHLQTRRTRGTVPPNNHLMAELTGLTLVGAAFPEFRRAEGWRETGLRLLEQQAPAQTHADGVNKEQATGYHRFVAELLLLIVARGRRGALPRSPILEDTAERMLDYVLFTLTPAGTAPMWGDSDYGRALGLGQGKDFWDFRPLLASGAVLFGRSDLKSAAGRLDEEAFWLLGPDALSAWEQLDAQAPEQTSRGFPEAGQYVLRDGWTTDADLALFRCGPFGLGGEGHCAHAHCDLLSIVLWINGQSLLVDSGTYLYHGPWRDPFRLAAAHNTVVIDGRDQASPMPNFNWQRVPEARCIAWTERGVTGELCYTGNVEFTRDVTRVRRGVWEVLDSFRGEDEHRLEWYFHFAPGLELELRDGGHTLTVSRRGRPFVVVTVPADRLRARVRDTWYSARYGVKEPARGLVARWEGRLDAEAVSFRWQFRLCDEQSQPGGIK